jgi:electron transfer flavoprotein beta subunit
MKIAVLVKHVPDTETKPQLDAGGMKSDGVKYMLNYYDEFAIEEAVKTKEKTKAELTAVTLGPDRAVQILQTAVAMGADHGVHIQCSEDELKKLDAFVVSKAIAEVLKSKGPFDVVFCGKQATDDDNFAVPQMVAEFAGMTRATVVTKFELAADSKSAKVHRSIEGGAEEVIELPLPTVVAAQRGLNKPRFVSVPGMMKARQKKMDVVPLASLNLGAGNAKVEWVSFEPPPEKKPGQVWKGSPEELASKIVNALRNEAKVI